VVVLVARSTYDLSGLLTLMSEDPTTAGARPVRRRFTQLVDALERARARYAICGAVAMGAHGARRFTEDIDVLIAAEDIEAVVGALATSMRELGREPAVGPTKQVRLRSKRARTSKAVDIDLLVPVDAVEAWALATAVRARAFDRKVDVASTEALVLMKLRAYLSDPESRSGGKHRVDAMTLLQTTTIDVAIVRRFVRSDPQLASELERALAAPPPRGRLG
jgi:hypothetical protein